METHYKKAKQTLFNLGTEIKILRRQKGFTQNTFASHVKLNRSYIGGVERGERNISALNLVKIAKGLEVPVGELFKGVK